MSNHTTVTKLYLPAYSAAHKGLLVTPSLHATRQEKLTVHTQGNVASALKRPLIRTLEIMASIYAPWESLLQFAYTLKSNTPQFRVQDTRSAGLPLAIGLLNVYRATLQTKPLLTQLIGTGMLRVDGSIESTHKEDIKQNTFQNKHAKQLITATTCPHLFVLEHMMNTHLH
ncbi:MAG: hypothetical protein P1U32_06085 [Legionellaceae bacterium]|nr:hypothetical protein [Legionellaceae bacterium]